MVIHKPLANVLNEHDLSSQIMSLVLRVGVSVLTRSKLVATAEVAHHICNSSSLQGTPYLLRKPAEDSSVTSKTLTFPDPAECVRDWTVLNRNANHTNGRSSYNETWVRFRCVLGNMVKICIG